MMLLSTVTSLVPLESTIRRVSLPGGCTGSRDLRGHDVLEHDARAMAGQDDVVLDDGLLLQPYPAELSSRLTPSTETPSPFSMKLFVIVMPLFGTVCPDLFEMRMKFAWSPRPPNFQGVLEWEAVSVDRADQRREKVRLAQVMDLVREDLQAVHAASYNSLAELADVVARAPYIA